jgi:hypothetical protein
MPSCDVRHAVLPSCGVRHAVLLIQGESCSLICSILRKKCPARRGMQGAGGIFIILSVPCPFPEPVFVNI